MDSKNGANTGVGQLKVLQKLSDYEFAVELRVMNGDPNRNGWAYANVDKYYKTFLGTPILCAYVGQQVGDGHNMRQKTDPKTGDSYYTFMDGTAERIVGAISEDPADLTLQKDDDGVTWIVAKGRLWAFYAPELVEKIVRTGRMDVSAETETRAGHKDGDIEVYTEWAGLGVTILGDMVDPAIPGANIKALAAMQSEFEEAKLKVASLRKGDGAAAKSADDGQIKPLPDGGTNNDTAAAQTNQTKRKGVKTFMGKNKQAISRMSEKFIGLGYHVVALSDDEMQVGLINGKGEPYTYLFLEEDKGTVVESRITPTTLSVSFTFDGVTDPLSADMAYVLDAATENLTKMIADKDNQIADLKAQAAVNAEAVKELEALKEQEHNRRIEAVKDAVVKTMEDIAENADDDDASVEEEANAIKEDAEAYACQEADGKFVGAEKARANLLAAYQEKRMKKLAEKRKTHSTSFAWVNANQMNGGQDDGGIDGLLNRLSH